MKASILIIAASLLSSTASILQASPIDYSRISATSDWYAHLDMDALVEGSIGSTILANLKPQQEAQLRTFERIFGFNLFSDVRGITLYGNAATPDAGVLIMDANFDSELLLDLIRSADDFTELTLSGKKAYGWRDENKGVMNYGAFVNDGLVLVSDQKVYVEEGLKVLTGQLPSLQAVTVGSADVDSTNTPFIICMAKLSELEHKPNAAFLKQAENGWFQVSEMNSDIYARLTLEMKNSDSAKKVQQVMQGFLALAIMNDNDPEVANLLGYTDIQQYDDTVNVQILAPSAEVLDFLKSREK